MMDAIVTARVPCEIKEQGNEILKKIGATPTELINAAYRYVLDNERLPNEKHPTFAEGMPLSEDDISFMRLSIKASTLAVPESFWQDKTYRDILEKGKRADYEALT